MKFNKQKILTKFLVFCFLLVESTGFDFYAHSVIYYYNNIQITHSYSILENFITLPRYGILSSIYEFVSSIGLPIGLIVSILIFLPINSIVNKFNFSNKKKIKLELIILVLFISVLIFFYSGLSISILYILSFLITKNKFYLIGVFFHPVTIFIFPILTIIMFNRRTKFLVLIFYIIFILYCYIFTKYLLQTCFNNEIVKFYIDSDNIMDLLSYTYELKPNEINLMIIISFLFLLIANNSKNILTKIVKSFNKNIFYLKHLNIILLSSLIFLQLYFNLKDRATFFNSFLSNNKVVYITWFDFGSKDFKASFETLSDQR